MARITRRGLAGLGVAAPFLARSGFAQGSYPDRPVRMIVPYSAGGVADTIARIIQPKVAEHLGQSFIIENRTGASGSIGAMAVAQSPADGHTFLFEGATFATLPLVSRSLPIDYTAAFIPVVQVTTQPYMLGVRAGFPARDLAEFVAEAKRRPGEITYGTPGVAHIGHFMGELLQLMAGIKLEHIPYRGGADVARELAGGRLDAGIISYSSLRPAVERGTTLLASTAAERQASLRQIPVMAETFPGYDLVSWTGCFAPAGTPEAVQNRFVAAIHHALKDPAIQARLEATGADSVISSPAAYQAVIAKDREVARRIVAATGLSIS